MVYQTRPLLLTQFESWSCVWNLKKLKSANFQKQVLVLIKQVSIM